MTRCVVTRTTWKRCTVKNLIKQEDKGNVGEVCQPDVGRSKVSYRACLEVASRIHQPDVGRSKVSYRACLYVASRIHYNLKRRAVI